MKGRANLIDKVEKVGYDRCFVSEVTLGELSFGAHFSSSVEKHRKEVDDTQKLFQLVSLTECWNLFGQEKARLRRKGNLIPDFDLLIGVISVHYKMVMVTNNEKHLSRIEGIVIENWIKAK